MGHLLQTPLIVFVLIVLPLWLILHYRSKRQLGSTLDQQERERLVQLAEQAERMNERIQVLEQILDDEVPDWRRQP